MGTSLSIIVPTVGRETLKATLDSIHGQLKSGDELIVVRDTEVEEEIDTFEVTLPYADTYLTVDGSTMPGRGSAGRMMGMDAALGSHLAFIDDDDCYLPGALELMRTVANETRPVIFRMRHHPWQVIIPFENQWGEFKFGNVGTPCFVVPNIRDKLGVWEPWSGESGSDFNFIRGCCEEMGEPIFRREIIAIVRPHEKVLASN